MQDYGIICRINFSNKTSIFHSLAPADLESADVAALSYYIPHEGTDFYQRFVKIMQESIGCDIKLYARAFWRLHV